MLWDGYQIKIIICWVIPTVARNNGAYSLLIAHTSREKKGGF